MFLAVSNLGIYMYVCMAIASLQRNDVNKLFELAKNFAEQFMQNRFPPGLITELRTWSGRDWRGKHKMAGAKVSLILHVLKR